LFLGFTLPRGVVHVDIKKEKTLFKKHHFETLLDFDNCYFDSFVVDIASTIMWWCIENHKINKTKMKQFLKEYSKTRKISKQEQKYILEALRFNLLKQAFKYAYICLPNPKFAEKNSHSFMKTYNSISPKH